MNTLDETRPTTAAVGPVGHLDRHGAVGLVAGAGGQPLPHLALDHDQERGDLRGLLQHPDDQRDGHVVGQVGHQGPRPARSPSSSVQSTVRASASTTRTPAGSTWARSTGSTWRSISTAVTDAPASASARVSEPSPAPISTTRLPGADTGEPDDAPDGVAVGHEVLPEGPARPQVVGQEQLVDLRSPVGHPVSVPPPGHRTVACQRSPATRGLTSSARRR